MCVNEIFKTFFWVRMCVGRKEEGKENEWMNEWVNECVFIDFFDLFIGIVYLFGSKESSYWIIGRNWIF